MNACLFIVQIKSYILLFGYRMNILKNIDIYRDI